MEWNAGISRYLSQISSVSPYTRHAHPLTRRYASRSINRWPVRAPALLVASDQDPATHLHYCLRLPAAVTNVPTLSWPAAHASDQTNQSVVSRVASRSRRQSVWPAAPPGQAVLHEYAQDAAAAAGNHRVARCLDSGIKVTGVTLDIKWGVAWDV